MTPDHGSGPEPAAFDELLRDRRRIAGLTQSDLAARAGVGVRTVRDLERGRSVRPQRMTVDLLAAALGLAGVDRERFVAAARGQDPSSSESDPLEPPRPAPGLGLPAPADLIGRDADVTELSGLLSAPAGAAPALVSLVGLAGVGKTSLALAVVARVAGRHPGGAAGVSIDEGSTENDVLSAVATVFGVARAADLAER
ncbi:helix-turn-helix domain-containing protein, partial [Micromonospora zhanjiangensis]